MNNFIDLTHTIENLMPVYPGDDETILLQSRKLEVEKYNNFYLKVNMHAGTHIDGPMHLTKSSTYIYQLPLERLIGKGCLINACGQSSIPYKAEYEYLIKESDIVLIYTGHDKKFKTDGYFNSYPIIEEPLADLLVRKNIKLLGIDSPSPDVYPFKIHNILFSSNIPIIENLTNLQELLYAENFEVIALPLKIKADSSILRVIAKII
jgi:kynurenine formamidase